MSENPWFCSKIVLIFKICFLKMWKTARNDRYWAIIIGICAVISIYQSTITRRDQIKTGNPIFQVGDENDKFFFITNENIDRFVIVMPFRNIGGRSAYNFTGRFYMIDKTVLNNNKKTNGMPIYNLNDTFSFANYLTPQSKQFYKSTGNFEGATKNIEIYLIIEIQYTDAVLDKGPLYQIFYFTWKSNKYEKKENKLVFNLEIPTLLEKDKIDNYIRGYTKQFRR